MTKVERIKKMLKIEMNNVIESINDCEETIEHFHNVRNFDEEKQAINRQQMYIHERNTYGYILNLVEQIDGDDND